jgi:dCMP deaminase
MLFVESLENTKRKSFSKERNSPVTDEKNKSESPLKDKRKTFPVLEINYENRRTIQRPSWDSYFLGIAEAASLRSHDGETQVGVVIVDENRRVLGTGYNGFPPGCADEKLPNLRPDKYPFMVHAEMNAIASSRQDLRNAALYVTWSPCRDCVKAIITAGIKTVVYRKEYRNEDFDFVTKLLNDCGIQVRHVPH